MKVTTPAYFTKFNCTCGDCIDSCCHGWEVKVDRQHYDALMDQVVEEPNDAAFLSRHIRVNENTTDREKCFAILAMREDGKCPMLDEDSLCLIHKKYGGDFLWNTCRMYPRVVSRLGDNFEITGTPSCPEVMRLCLATLDPYVLVPVQESIDPEKLVVNQETLGANDFYTVGFKQVRGALLEIIADEHRPLKGRLLNLATAANEVSAFYFKRCPEFDWLHLTRTLDAVLAEEHKQECDRAMQEFHSAEPLALTIALSSLEIFHQQDLSTQCGQLYSMIMAAHPEAKREDFPNVNYFASVIRQRRESLDDNCLLRLDRGIGRYVGNCLLREWFTDMPDVMSYLQMLLARCAILRFLLLMHPMLPSVKTEDQMDELLINVIYAFSRDIDHSHQFLRILFRALEEQQMLDYAYSAAFIDL